MVDDDLQHIFDEYFPQYIEEKVSMSDKQLERMIGIAAHNARVHYGTLPEPKSCSLEIYVQIWVRDTISLDFTKKTIKSFTLSNPPPHWIKTAHFLKMYSEESQTDFREKIYNAPRKERESMWNNFKIPLDEIEKRFKNVIQERNLQANEEGFDSKIEWCLSRDQIPKQEYQNFIQNKDQIITFCNNNLPDSSGFPDWFYIEFNTPCFKCQLPSIPFKTEKEILDFIVQEYPIARDYREKIEMTKGNSSYMHYNIERDIFGIKIDGTNNTRHALLDFFHELCHVVHYLDTFKKAINPIELLKYEREKEALRIELLLLQKISKPLYQTMFCEMLTCFLGNLFQIELYKASDNDRINLSGLYAKMFNHCFKRAKQNTNRSWLLNGQIIFQSFYSLRHAVAYGNIILESMYNTDS